MAAGRRQKAEGLIVRAFRVSRLGVSRLAVPGFDPSFISFRRTKKASSIKESYGGLRKSQDKSISR